MSLVRPLALLAAPALLALGGCAAPFRADVARFQALPAPQGQSFYVQAADPRNQGGLEFAQYAGLVSQRLTQQGYRPADRAGDATLVVTLGYGVDNGREKVVSTPGLGGGFGYYGWGGRRWGGWGYSPWRWGWNDPFLDPWGPEVSSYTVYTSHLDMVIRRTADGQSLFEGSAKARSRDDNLMHLVPNLVEAMFTNFPGRSGETVKITIPPPPRQASR